VFFEVRNVSKKKNYPPGKTRHDFQSMPRSIAAGYSELLLFNTQAKNGQNLSSF